MILLLLLPTTTTLAVLSAVLVLVGLFIRMKVGETPAFAKALESHKTVKMPFVQVKTTFACIMASR